MAHITSGCSKLAGTEYTERHNNVASIVYRAICAEYNLEHNKDWWVKPEKVARTGLIIDIEVPRDENIQDKQLKKLTDISH